MILSQREKYIAALCILAVSVLLIDSYVLTPALERSDRLSSEKQALTQAIETGEMLVDRMDLMARKWDERLAKGLQIGRTHTESQMLHALRDWAADAGLDLASMKPLQAKKVPIGEQPARAKDKRDHLLDIPLQISATGGMEAVARFLWELETTELPVRITQFQLGARREGSDDLSLQLRVSALCVPADTQARPVAFSRKDD